MRPTMMDNFFGLLPFTQQKMAESWWRMATEIPTVFCDTSAYLSLACAVWDDGYCTSASYVCTSARERYGRALRTVRSYGRGGAGLPPSSRAAGIRAAVASPAGTSRESHLVTPQHCRRWTSMPGEGGRARQRRQVCVGLAQGSSQTPLFHSYGARACTEYSMPRRTGHRTEPQ